MSKGHLMADIVSNIGSIDVVFGEIYAIKHCGI